MTVSVLPAAAGASSTGAAGAGAGAGGAPGATRGARAGGGRGGGRTRRRGGVGSARGDRSGRARRRRGSERLRPLAGGARLRLEAVDLSRVQAPLGREPVEVCAPLGLCLHERGGRRRRLAP